MARPGRPGRPRRRAPPTTSRAASPRPRELTVVVSAVPRSRPAGRPPRPLPARRHRAGQRGVEEGTQGPRRPRARSERARGRAEIAARDAERARGAWGARLGDVDLADARLADVRATILVSDTGEPALRRHPAGRRRPARPAHPRAGRGGAAHRQRRGRLRRAPRRLAGPARRARPRPVRRPAPAGRARPRPGRRRPRAGAGRAHLGRRRPHRGPDRGAGRRPARGRTTVVCTVSPLWLHHADRVVAARDDRVVTEGRHDDLLADDPAYRARRRPRARRGGGVR